jgi:hypothetical protein
MQVTYRIREKLAYSKVGASIAGVIRNRWFPDCRVHWVQQAFADWSTQLLGTVRS